MLKQMRKMSTVVENRAPGCRQLCTASVGGCQRLLGECGSAFDWGEVFPKCWVLERFCTLRRAGPGEMCSLHRPHSPWKRKCSASSFVSLRAVLAESHHSKGLLESADR